MSRGSEPGVGFRFCDLAGEDSDAVEALMASRPPLFFPEDELAN